MDTWLYDSRHRFILGRGVIPKGRVAPQPIIEHLSIFEDILCRFGSRGGVPMIDEITLECPKETFHAGVLSTIPFAAHAGMRPDSPSNR